jgi:NAD(P) transhydrogenase
MSEHFDLVIIGAGPAGEKGAAQAAYFGKRVCVVERAPKPGGAAVNTGTVPSKTLRETALYFSGLRQRGLYGIDYTVKRDITIADFMYRERAVVESSWALIDDNLKRHHVTTVQGSAHFVDAHTIEVARYHQEPRRITGDVFLVASGSMPARPPQVPFDDLVVVDSDTILRLPKIPRNMIVIGGGVIGCEYACTFAALGVRVTLVNARERLLMQLDHEVSETLCARMTARLGIQVLTDTEVAGIETTEDGQYARVTLTDGRVIGAECVLYSAGRQGCTADLALGQAGVKTNRQGYVTVDDCYRTSTPHIYAAGDVIGFPALASTAMEQARVAICHAFDLRYKERISPVLPYGVWTIPEVAMCGETEDSARTKGLSHEVGKSSFRINPRGQIIGDTEGFIKLVFRPEDQRLLGVSIVGEGACELIHVGMACMMYQGTIDFFIQSVFNYPTLSDAYKYAAYDGLQRLAKRVSGRTGLPSIGSD